MRTSAAVALILAGTALGSLSMTSCFVSRRSEGYACSPTGQCDDGRTCENGYCVQAACPSPCTSCDIGDRTCKIECTSNKPCGAIQCPAGFDCAIKCNNTSACSDIDCRSASSCNVECSGGSSCGAITCRDQPCVISCSGGSSCGAITCGRDQPCDIDCAGASSCPAINCRNSCRCDAKCNSPAACPSPSCPLDLLDDPCTDGGMAGARCDSTSGPLCDSCI